MSTVFLIEAEQDAKPEWLPAEQVQHELHLSRYLFKRLRKKYQLEAKRTIDRRMRLIDINEVRRAMAKELASVQAE